MKIDATYESVRLFAQRSKTNLVLLRVAVIICFAWIGLSANAQQDFINGYYMFNPLSFNPAIVGVNDQFVASGIGREQWTGINGAPNTQYFNIHAPVYSWFDRYDRVDDIQHPTGLSAGLTIANDKIGARQYFRLSVPIGYRVRLNEKGMRLSVGIRTDLTRLSFNMMDLENTDPGDIYLRNSGPQDYLDFSAGAYLYDTKWYVGVSSTNLREMDLGEEFGYLSFRHWYVSAGFALPVTTDLSFRTTTLATLVKGAPFSMTVTPAIIIKENIETGVSYRYHDMFGAFFSVKPFRNFRVGYWYEYPIGVKTNEIGGTHEIMLQYTFDLIKKQVVSPRYFW